MVLHFKARDQVDSNPKEYNQANLNSYATQDKVAHSLVMTHLLSSNITVVNVLNLTILMVLSRNWVA